MTPTGRRKDIAKSLPQTQSALAGVLCYTHIFVRQDREHIGGVEVFDQAIINGNSAIFLNKRSEHAIPDNQRTSEISVEIFGITAMMHPVVAWRVEDIFEPSRQTVNRFGMQEKLVGRVENAAKNHQRGIKSCKNQRNFQHHCPGKVLHPALPKRNRHVEIGRRVVDDMHCPAPPDTVTNSMMQVEAQVVEDEAQQE